MVVTNVMIYPDDAASNRKNKFIIFFFFYSLYYFKKDGRPVGLSFGLLIVGNQSASSPLRNSGLYIG
jgi:hypothetical protein